MGVSLLLLLSIGGKEEQEDDVSNSVIKTPCSCLSFNVSELYLGVGTGKEASYVSLF